MFSKPRQLTTESELYDAACRALMRRAHSVHEMKKVLIRRTDNEKMIKSILDRLKTNGLIDDARYAKQFARQHTQIRRQGKFRIARDLRARGVPDRHIEAAIEDSADPASERAVIRQRIERKLKSLGNRKTEGEELDQRKIASIYRSLLGAGFPADAIRRELKSITRGELPEVDSES